MLTATDAVVSNKNASDLIFFSTFKEVGSKFYSYANIIVGVKTPNPYRVSIWVVCRLRLRLLHFLSANKTEDEFRTK